MRDGLGMRGAMALLLAWGAAPAWGGAKSLATMGVAVTENFDSLPSAVSTAWTDDSVLPGCYADEVGVASFDIVPGPGSSILGNLYSFATNSSPADRALGSLSDNGTQHVAYGIRFKNNTGATIGSLTVSYHGEQYRQNGNAAAQSLQAFYRVSSGSITSVSAASGDEGGTYTAAPSLDFTGPFHAVGSIVINGNVEGQVTISATIPVTVAPGSELMLKWLDTNDSGNDHALAIDDLSVTPVAGVPVELSLFRVE